MTSPVYYTVECDLQGFIEDASSDSDYNPQVVPLSATVTFTPRINSGDIVLATNASPRPTGYIPAPITAIIDAADGRLKLRTGTDAGATGFTFAPVRLLASSPLLELTNPLEYEVSFSEVTFPNGRRGSIAGFVFEAPTTDTVVNLIEVARVPGQPQSGITKIAPGAVRLEDGDIVFSFASVDIPERIPFTPAFTSTEMTDSTSVGRAVITAASTAAARTAIGAENAAMKGASGGYAPLDSTAKIDAAYLPSYVDDVLSYANQAAFPGTGETGKIYVAQDTGDAFRWTGSAYLRISDRVTAAGITDSTSVGRAVVTTASAAAARDTLDVPGLESFALSNNAATNILLDGSYERDSTWWAGALGTGLELSTTRAYRGTQSLKITGPRIHFPNVTGPGKTGVDETYGRVKADAGGRVYRISFKVWRESGNSTSGNIRALLRANNANGNFDAIGSFNINGSLLQSTMPAGEWVSYSGDYFVTENGANAPYVSVHPSIWAQSVDAADVFYVDDVRFEDITDTAPELVAPPATGNRTIDTANVQKLVDIAQATRGTVVLRAGTYAIDITSSRSNGERQPRIIGQGVHFTKIDGTIKFQGPGGGLISGGYLSDFSFVGSNAGKAAIEFNGVVGCRFNNIYVTGTYGVGVWFHNELTNAYTELCVGTASFYDTCITALKYTVSAVGNASFHGSGLIGDSHIQHVGVDGPAILIETNARPYNSPLDVRVWTGDLGDATYPVIQHNGESRSNFTGNFTIESTGTNPIVAGTALWYVGTVTSFMSTGLTVNYGPLRVVKNLEVVNLGTLSIGPQVARQIQDINGNTAFQFLSVNNAVNHLNVYNSAATTRPLITAAGSDANIDIGFVPKGAGGLNVFVGTGQTGTLSVSGADANHNLNLISKGSGTVQANGDPVTTQTNTQALSNKDLTSATNTFPTLNQNTTGSAATLTTGRTVQTDLASGSAATFNGSANITPGVTGTLPIANGGTSAATQQAAITALTGTQVSGRYLRSDGTNAALSAIQAADVPTLNQSTTGSAATLTTGRTIQTDLASGSSASFNGSANITPGVTGTLPVTSGGTGVTTITGLVKGAGTTALTAAVAGTDYVAPGGSLGTPSSGTLTNTTGLPISGLVSSTSTALGVGSIELGHASDTTLTRSAAGKLAVEGTDVLLNGGALGTPTSGTLSNCVGTDMALTTPKIDSIKGTNGNTALVIDDQASATNYVRVSNSNGARPTISTRGASTNIDLVLRPKGNAGVQLFLETGSETFVEATGGASNINLTLYPKGTGIAKVGANPIGVKVAVPATATSTGVAGQWAVDSSYVYFATGTNTWVRAAVASW